MKRRLDTIAMHWLGRRHGWPVRAGRKFFYEPDESWTPGHGIYVAESPSNVVIRNNVIRDNRAGGIHE